MSRTKRAFTLIELLVVVAIIALLISILLPSLSAAKEQARRAVCSSQVRQLVMGMVNYSMDNRDEVPMNEGTEPSYVFVRKGQSGDQQWCLGELILPYVGYDAPQRSGSNNSFTDEDFELTAGAGKMFYCPSTKNFSINDSARFANWMDFSTYGAFMDYAQMWNWVGPFLSQGRVSDSSLIVTSPQGAYAVLDDEQNAIAPSDFPTQYGSYNPTSGMLYRLPHSLSKERLMLPGAGGDSRVPVMMDYMVSRGTALGSLGAAWDNGTLTPETANHLWSGRNAKHGAVKGGNYGYADGSVQWKGRNEVRPRLMLMRTFDGQSPYPTYWW